MKKEKYYRTQESFGLALEYCGVEHCEPTFQMPTHHREGWLIHYIFQGEGEFSSDGKSYPVAAGDAFAIFPGVLTSYRASPENPFCFCWFGVSGDNAPRLVERCGFIPAAPVLALHDAGGLPDLVNRCLELCDQGGEGAELELQSALYRLFGALEAGREHEGRKSGANYLAAEHVQQAKSFIQFHYMSPLTIRQVAQQVNLERTYFSKIFRQLEGVTPQLYLLRYRLESAKRLLRDTHYPVGEIGALVGIPDAYYFSRAFKKHTGLPPRAYRRDREPPCITP